MAEELLGEARTKKGSADKSPSLASVKPSAPSAPHMALRIALGTAGLLLVVGFFLPWLKIAGSQGEVTYTGMELVVSNERAIRTAIGETQRWILLVIPVIGLALTAVGYLGFRWSGQASAIAGLVLIGYGVFVVVAIFIQATALGLWLILLGTFTATGVGIAVWLRMRSAKTTKAADLPPKLGGLDDVDVD